MITPDTTKGGGGQLPRRSVVSLLGVDTTDAANVAAISNKKKKDERRNQTKLALVCMHDVLSISMLRLRTNKKN
jgi:hypothetical protein